MHTQHNLFELFELRPRLFVIGSLSKVNVAYDRALTKRFGVTGRRGRFRAEQESVRTR